MVNVDHNDLMRECKAGLFSFEYISSRSDQKNMEESYKQFIGYAFKQSVDYLNLFQAIGGDVSLSDYQIDSFSKIESDHELDGLFTKYCQLVKAHKPFTDIFSMMHEQLLLTGRRGDGLGQFYTPPDLSDALAELMPLLSSQCSVGDICSGAGSLKLAALKRCALENPDALGSLCIVLADIDEFACKVAFLQIAANIIVHRKQIGLVEMYNCNVITEWRKPGSLMVRYTAPDSVVRRSIKAGRVKAFNELIAMLKSTSERRSKALAS